MEDETHVAFMRLALEEAQACMREGEVPVGAVVVQEREVLSRSGNRVERDRDATAHAELLALQGAMQKLGHKWLPAASLYVTLEPCPLCAGAILLARVGHVIFGARDPKAGAFASVTDFPLTGRFNHLPRVTPGVMAAECGAVLSDYFASLRPAKRTRNR